MFANCNAHLLLLLLHQSTSSSSVLYCWTKSVTRILP
jgi:hypothetical protein